MAELLTPESLRRLSDADYDIAPGEPDVRGWDVVLSDDEPIGEVEELIVDLDAARVRYLDIELDRTATGLDRSRHVLVPIDRARLDTDHKHVVLTGATRATLTSLPEFDGRRFDVPDERAFGRTTGESSGTQRLTRSAEELRIGKRVQQTGEVRVSKHVETEHVKQDVPVQRERVHVERRPVEGTSGAAPIRDEDVVVPVMEEEVVVEKRPVVKEEVVVSKSPETSKQRVEADVRREKVDVKPSSGDVTVEGDVKKRGGK